MNNMLLIYIYNFHIIPRTLAVEEIRIVGERKNKREGKKFAARCGFMRFLLVGLN